MSAGRISDISEIARKASPALAVAVGLGGVGAVLLVVQMILLAKLVADVALQRLPVEAEFWPFTGFLCAALMRCCVQWASEMTGEQAAQKVVTVFRQDLIQRLFRIGPVGLQDLETGRLATSLTDSVAALQPYIAQYIPRAAAMVILPCVILAVVAGLDGWSFLILAVTGPLIPIFMALVGYSAQGLMDRQWTRLLLLGASFFDALQGLTTLRLFGQARESVKMVQAMAEAHRLATMRVMRVAFLTSAVLEFFSSLAVALVAIVLGSRLLSGQVDFQTSFLVLLLAPEYFAPLRNFSASYHARQNALSAMDGLMAFMRLPELCVDQGARPHQAKTAAPEKLIFKDVSAGYGQGSDILCGISFTAHRGTITAVTGASGCGKTTLLHILLGMMPVRAGEIIAVDDAGSRIAAQNWRIGWVPQSPHLLNETIRDNLRLADPDADDTRLRSVAALAGVLSFINDLPDGLDTVVGDRGTALSGGEVRRLALARALMNAPDILVFDEPTADLDSANAAMIATALKQLAASRIVIAVSHRPDILHQATQVFHLPEGVLHLNEIQRAVA
ncbi:thiol reductant ABC exporter subunit CydD [Acetobacter tropicalis]|uniref:thiol reductant ABC exporter subunit CydD n=1 Tax=Acetobacter tropicalis TaxID=104102 RepID=UPI000776B7DB|nr:thiol reductant ABC exporter subunit CydD [Acetobacter tropicalis]